MNDNNLNFNINSYFINNIDVKFKAEWYYSKIVFLLDCDVF